MHLMTLNFLIKLGAEGFFGTGKTKQEEWEVWGSIHYKRRWTSAGEQRGHVASLCIETETPLISSKGPHYQYLGRGVWSVSLKSFIDTHFRDEQLHHPRCQLQELDWRRILKTKFNCWWAWPTQLIWIIPSYWQSKACKYFHLPDFQSHDFQPSSQFAAAGNKLAHTEAPIQGTDKISCHIGLQIWPCISYLEQLQKIASLNNWLSRFFGATPHAQSTDKILCFQKKLTAHRLSLERQLFKPLSSDCQELAVDVSLWIIDGQWRFMMYMDFMYEMSMEHHWPKNLQKPIM